jgi:hypothetical protein
LLRRLLETTDFDVTFYSVLLPEEPKYLARRRMRAFCRLLKAEQIDRDRIVLSREVRRYDPDQPDEYLRLPGIQGIIRGE